MRFVTFCRSAVLGALLGVMLSRPELTRDSAYGALQLFAQQVLPTLLPFTVCMLLFTAGKTLPMGALAALGLLSGSPTGAKLCQQAGAKGSNARHLAAVTGVISPMFFIGTLSSWYGAAALWAYGCHVLSALLCGCVFRAGSREKKCALPPLTLPQAVEKGAKTMLTVAASLCMGAVLAALLPTLLPLPERLRAALHAVLEITGGCHALWRAQTPFAWLCALLSFNGFSILLQNAVLWKESGLTLGDLLLLGLCRAGIACALGHCVSYLFAL